MESMSLSQTMRAQRLVGAGWERLNVKSVFLVSNRLTRACAREGGTRDKQLNQGSLRCIRGLEALSVMPRFQVLKLNRCKLVAYTLFHARVAELVDAGPWHRAF